MQVDKDALNTQIDETLIAEAFEIKHPRNPKKRQLSVGRYI
jgi:hypothetical protein